MPGFFQTLSVITPAGHQVRVATDSIYAQDITELKSLECIQCGNINYLGRKVEGCNHTVCQSCMDKDDSLKTGKHDCNGSIVSDKTLTDYSIETKAFLDQLTVSCAVKECTQQAPLSEIDLHITEHANSPGYSAQEILVVIDVSELPPNVLWYEHEGIIYYVPDPDAPER